MLHLKCSMYVFVVRVTIAKWSIQLTFGIRLVFGVYNMRASEACEPCESYKITVTSRLESF